MTMANGASDVGSRSFALPLALVGALAAGALAPHLTTSPSPTTLVAPSARAGGPVLSVAGAGQDRDHVTTALDLLAEYFGIDISPAALRREMRSVAKEVQRHADYSGPKRSPMQQARLLRAFFCMEVRTSGAPIPRKDGFAPLWQDLGDQDPAPPGCTPAANTGGRKKQATLRQVALRNDALRDAAQWIEDYLNDDARRDHVTVTRALAGVRVAKMVDESRLRADDFDRVDMDKTPLAWELVHEAADRHNTSVQALIATVPDPVDSYESWRFDSYVDAIRQGIEKSGYLLDRFYLPDVDPERKADPGAARKDLHTGTPGVILFRWANRAIPSPTADQTKPLLVLFLVPETPVAGIHAAPFVSAIEFARDWMPVHTAAAGGAGADIRILGPSFSGSTPSMVRALRDAHDLLLTRTPTSTSVTIISGGATVDKNRELFETPEVPYGSTPDGATFTVHFRATTERDSAVHLATNSFLQEAAIRGLRADLSEGSTAYGSSAPCPGWRQTKDDKQPGCSEPSDRPLTMKYPFNVSQLRNDASREGTPRRDPLADVIPRLRPLALEDAGPPTDQLPLVRPDTAVSAIELVLSNQLDAARDNGVRVVTINATDVRDKLFLVKELREHVPDALPVITDTDLFEVHPDQARWLKGVVVVSTYPLRAMDDAIGEDVQAPGYSRERVQFSSANVEGTYNAAIALLNYDIDGKPDARFRDVPDKLPPLVDYSAPGCSESREPAVWVSVVGTERIVPLKVYCGVDAKFGDVGYVFKPQPATAVPPPVAPAAISMSRPAVALIVLILVLAAGGIARFAVVRFARSAGSAQGESPLAAERGTLALALCGPLIPLVYLDVTLPVLMRHQWRAGDASSGLLALAAAIGLAETGLAVAAQFLCRSPRYREFRALFLVAAVDVGVYAVHGLRAAPELLLARTFDVGALVSPLVPFSLFGVVPVLLALVGLWRLGALGGRVGERVDVPAEWTSALHAVAGWAGISLEGLDEALRSSHTWLLNMPPGWLTVSFGATVLVYVFTFGIGQRPALSIEGQTFAFLGVFFVVLLQWLLMASLTRFVYAAYFTKQFLVRAADHALDLPYDAVPKALFSFGLIPARPQLRELRSMAELVGGASHTLDADLKSERPRPRWFQSATWGEVTGAIKTLGKLENHRELENHVHRRTLVATSLVMVVRELLSRLSVSLGFIGPALVLLLTLQGTLHLDRSHCLLGLVWADVILSSIVVMTVFIVMERDATVSRMLRTNPGLDWNWDFTLKVVVYVALPLATVFAAQFPELGSSVLRLLEPVQRLPGG
jgi:hypothetical protein